MKRSAEKPQVTMLDGFLDRLISQRADREDKDALLDKLLTFVRKSFGMEVAFISEFDQGQRIFRHVSSDYEFRPVQAGDSNPLEESSMCDSHNILGVVRHKDCSVGQA